MNVQSITEEWKSMKKRKGNTRLMTINGHAVLKENNYSLQQVPFLDSLCMLHPRMHAQLCSCFIPDCSALHAAGVLLRMFSKKLGLLWMLCA